MSLHHTQTVIDAQANIDHTINGLKEWTATLYFEGVVGFPSAVELFQYTQPHFKDTKGQKPLIIFDPDLYPPTNEGLHI